MDYKWLEDLRKSLGLTQEEVADKAEVNRSYIAKIEAGQTPSVRVAKRIGSVLGFSWQKFFEDGCDDTSQKPTGTES